ncbi:hypothetical protein Tco_0851014 [Tanacetum coccineum]
MHEQSSSNSVPQRQFSIETLQDFGNMYIFKRTFSQDLDLLANHLTKEIISQTDCKTTLTKLRTTFENTFNSELKARMQNYTRYDAQSFYDAMIFNMDSLGKYMLELILHQQRTPQLLKQKKLMQTQEDHSNPIPALNVDSLKVDLVVIQNTCSEKEDSNSETASSKLVKECSLNSETKDVHAIKYKMSKAKERCMTYFRSLHFTDLQVLYVDTFTRTMLLNVDQLQKQLDKDEFQEDGSMTAFWVVNNQFQKFIDSKFTLDYDKSIRTDSTVQDDNSRSGNDTDADDADIRPIYDEEPMAEVQLTAECNIFAIGQQHTKQPEIIVEGRVDQYPETCQVKSPMLDSSPNNQTTEYSKQSLESENILLKETVAQFQKDFSRMEAHCIALELKYQNQSLKSGQHGQILNETSNKAKIEKEIDVLETMNIELEHMLSYIRKENETLKQHYKDLYDSIKITRSKTTEQTTSLLANNAELKAQIQEKVFAIAALKNDLRKLKGNSFSPNKTSAVYEKISPRSDFMWKPTGRIFKSVGLRWIPTGKLFDSCTSKVDSEPPHGLNVDIPHIHECKQTLDVSAGKSQSMVAEKADISETIVKVDSQMMIQKNDDVLFGPLFDEYFNGENQVVLKSSAVTTTHASNKRQQQPDSTSSTSTLATTVTADGNFDLLEKNEYKRIMPTKIELTLEQSQQVVSDDVLSQSAPAFRLLKPSEHRSVLEWRSNLIRTQSAKPCQEDSYEFYLITVKEMMQDKDLKNSKSKDKDLKNSKSKHEGSRSRSRSMNAQSHYKQEKTKTRPKKAKLKRHIVNVGEIKEDLNIGGDC